MASLGDMLRAAREERGITLPEAERETKIRLKYLSAMEDDNPAAMPGPTYARGFLRNYAAYLGLDPNEAVELFEEQSQPTRDKLKAARGRTPARASGHAAEKISIQPISTERIDTRVRYGSQYIALSLLAIPLIIVFYFVYNAYAGPRSQTPPIPQLTPRPATPTKLAAPTVVVQGPATGAFNTPTVYVPASPSVVSGTLPITQAVGGVITATTPLTPTAAAVPAASEITVRVDTTRDAWMSVLVDGVQRFSGTLPRGATREWKGRNTIQIRTGRADSVRVTINGADRGFMGAPGRNVVEKRWNREGQETVIR
ncbi:MAG TPA: RodZ domain-containing protein [Chloroflexia bacterium]|nr:RodZ domain-containing protein [Chloroflexia bacterium]